MCVGVNRWNTYVWGSNGLSAVRKKGASLLRSLHTPVLSVPLYKIYVLQTCYDVAIMHSEVWRLNSWQRICAYLVFGVLAVNVVLVVQELEMGVINYLAWFQSFTFFTDVNNKINVHFELINFSRKEVFAACRRYLIQKFAYTFACLPKIVEKSSSDSRKWNVFRS
jgi:hypothetical protein